MSHPYLTISKPHITQSTLHMQMYYLGCRIKAAVLTLNRAAPPSWPLNWHAWLDNEFVHLHYSLYPFLMEDLKLWFNRHIYMVYSRYMPSGPPSPSCCLHVKLHTTSATTIGKCCRRNWSHLITVSFTWFKISQLCCPTGMQRGVMNSMLHSGQMILMGHRFEDLRSSLNGEKTIFRCVWLLLLHSGLLILLESMASGQLPSHCLRPKKLVYWRRCRTSLSTS